LATELFEYLRDGNARWTPAVDQLIIRIGAQIKATLNEAGPEVWSECSPTSVQEDIEHVVHTVLNEYVDQHLI
jgi:hypothetical protein